MRGVSERLAAAPAEAADRHDLVAGRQVFGEIEHGIQIGRHLLLLQLADAVAGFVLGAELRRVAAAGGGAAEQIGRDGQVARFGQLIGHAADPIGEASVFVNHDHRGRRMIDFGIHDPSMHLAAALRLDVGPLMMPRRLLQAVRARPAVLTHIGQSDQNIHRDE